MDLTITDTEFDQISKLVYDQSGIVLKAHKKTMLVSRLGKQVRHLGLNRFEEYYQHVLADPGGEEMTLMLDLVSTNKTDFFREPKHFEFLRDEILPGLDTEKRIRVWSSACSSGEEPYTIAMTILDAVKNPAQWNIKILATDLSTRVLEKAVKGLYEESAVKGVPTDTVQRHFLRGRGASSGKIKVKPHLPELIKFRRMNLMDNHYPIKTPLDVIFCRNVMIYFDRDTQAALMVKFHRHLKPGGYLFIGHYESLQWVDHEFTYVAPTIYRKA
jgi:chemotaxis protein methyltransferase CheR